MPLSKEFITHVAFHINEFGRTDMTTNTPTKYAKNNTPLHLAAAGEWPQMREKLTQEWKQGPLPDSKSFWASLVAVLLSTRPYYLSLF